MSGQGGTHTTFTGVDYDVVIAGGGLAGLCLAKQLKDAHPTLSVLVCERERSPVPLSAFKVGESTVEVGAHYFASVIGLRDYLEEQQLEKLGLRYFYGDRPDFHRESEFGVNRFLPAKSYQLNRGSLEEHLRVVAAGAGAELVQGVRVTDIELGERDAPHRVTYQGDDEGSGETAVSCRWVVDATGRHRLLQRKLGLTKRYPKPHNSVWFRLEGRLDTDELVAPGETTWHDRVHEPRWNSTNHFMFEGGWVWAIPLAPDHTSVGIVVSDDLHPVTKFNRIEKAIDFVVERVPGFDPAIRELPVLDFRVLKNYSHSSQQVFSHDRWACVGDAAVFADPYYSVGSNLIGYANSFVTEMIGRDRAESFEPDFVRYANRWFLSLAEGLTQNIQGSYAFHHNPVIMSLKTIWDYYVGWAFSDPQFYGRTYLDESASTTLSALGAPVVATQGSMMNLLKDWSRSYRGVFEFDYIDYYDDLPTLARLFVQNLPGDDDATPAFGQVLASIRDGIDRIEELAHVVFYLALEDALPEHLDSVRARGWLNVSALSLDPERWERDGLFAPKSRPRLDEVKKLEEELRRLYRVSSPVAQ
ncbi:NAD(P)/FAD-dependent oxidoreductase [Streptomyces actinomycinicus]|uniref:NAD(P)/FAD-dependent oxidoreductase n=1 Tax=Streptomyces actinomycinicus TaxID=1695166 RepID=A0A937JPC8_9ACTN|nr:NAD(P)/FAD-dependent oxidoreductase [Streptomyces actinomycinicus]MBL1082333.1 NAD(P)/FAD-dependent oxidoreductase [Streptomyces actinomycinicus]